MVQSGPDNGKDASRGLPPLQRDAKGRIDVDSVPEVIQWFLDYDERVALIKHPRVEEVFQWKQEQSRIAREDVFSFKRAEDRLAIGIIQALAENSTERELHTWISQLLNALDVASKANESTSQKIPSERDRGEFLINCWVETLCTAEARVLGWLYKEFYGRPYSP